MVKLENISHALKEALHSLVSHPTGDTESLNIIESDFEHDKYKDKLESRDPRLNNYNYDFEDSVEVCDFRFLKNCLSQTLLESCAWNGSCFIDMSSEQVDHLAHDVIRMSHMEPCGVRGAIIFIVIQRKNFCQKLATVKGDPNRTPTFEVYVTLKEDTSRWKAFKKVFLTLREYWNTARWKGSPVVLCSGFQLEKKRLYRPYAVQ